MRTVDHVLEVPLDHARPDGPSISVYAREVSEPGGQDRPFLVFLQGGPGSESPRPDLTGTTAWMTRALQDFRLLLLDQRGTGRSTPVGLPERIPGGTTAEKAEYLTHFRADSIVDDLELLREHLRVERWSLLGQSFGGFTSLTYLSTHADRLDRVHLTGGLAAVGVSPDDIYATTFAVMHAKSERFHAQFPAARDRMRRALDLARAGELRLPNGDLLTPRLLRSIGGYLGRDGGAQTLAHLLEHDPHAPAFTHDVAAMLHFRGRNPIYSVLHESSCSDGYATRWAADRVQPPAYDEDETLLFGEHIAPASFEDNSELRPYAELAHALAGHEWPRLYDEEALRRADVPIAASVYYDDAFVPREMSLRTASLLPRVHPWITNEYEHNGLRTSGERVLDRLLGLTLEL
ncbi:MAG: alpha/beta fold hydrolase [Nocardioides sp.]